MTAQALRRPAFLRTALVLLLLCQLMVWWQVRDIRPQLDIVAEVPTHNAAQAMSLGDAEFYFRWLALNVQNSGDTYGRFTALREYDYARLYAWLELLDSLDSHSNMMPSMAAYYFSQTQKTEDIRYLVDYLYAHATRDIANKWWWLIQAGYLANHKLNDMDLTLKVSKPLLNPAVPVWAQQMLAVVHESRGEMDDALNIMEAIRDHAEHIPDADLRYMEYFVRERLHKLEEFNQKAPKAP